ncbi:unnamed protein product [Camellia sinensis]
MVSWILVLFEGVSSSTITVQSVHNTNKDLIWSPLSTNNSGSSQAWVTHLTFHEENLHSLQTHPVKVSLGHSQGIVSLSGFHHSHTTHFEFTVLIQPHGSQHAEMKSAEMISWEDENFHTGETHLLEPTQIKIFNQLRNSEIALFWELLSEINWLMSYDKTPETCKMAHSEENEYSLVVLKQLTSRLQAMQLLSCLNLSNNKMGSFSALEPLTLLKSLKVLDISYNEIGAHAVDT